MREHQLIQSFFEKQNIKRPDVILGIGDDAAVVTVPEKQQLVVATDTLVAGVHFPENTSPEDIGYKALAVNLSDLAAMGATPAWASLAITLPNADETWLHAFCQGFFELAAQHNVQLIGGDTTQGPLTVTVSVQGFVPQGEALTRTRAKAGDEIYVTGYLGAAGLALRALSEGRAPSETQTTQLNRPVPRVAAGMALRNIASAAIDISDGLAADLGHIVQQSQVGACITLAALPVSAQLAAAVSPEERIELALHAGDDYELCFTAPLAKREALAKAFADLDCPYCCIGVIYNEAGLRGITPDGETSLIETRGYEHF